MSDMMGEVLFGLMFVWLGLAAVRKHLKWKKQQESAGAGMVCANCSTTGAARRRRKGSDGVEVLMWLFFLLPGIVYSTWRRSGKTQWFECHACGSTDLIPLDSQRAHALLGEENRAQGARERDERECPYCAEPILAKAKVCKHCGRDVEPIA